LAWGVPDPLPFPVSGAPQLIEITEGLRRASCVAVVIASRKPRSVLGAKYTTILAFGATAPATSISNMTSPSAPSGPSGRLRAPSIDTPVTVGLGRPRPARHDG